MSNRGHPFVVEVKRRPNADFTSKRGDDRRQGRVDGAPGAAQIKVAFIEASGAIEARLGVICVARITANPAGGFLWAGDLPMVRVGARPAGDLEKAKGAIEHQVRQWCEAAALISAKRKSAP